MGKRLGLKVSDGYREVAAIRRWSHLEVRLYFQNYNKQLVNSVVLVLHDRIIKYLLHLVNWLYFYHFLGLTGDQKHNIANIEANNTIELPKHYHRVGWVDM